MRRYFLGGIVALGLLLSACGGGGDDEKASDDSEASDRRDEESDDGARGSATTDGEAGAEGEDTAAAEGDGSGGPGRDEYVDALGAAGDPGAPDAAAMDCVTNAYIDVIGIDRLNAATTPEEVAQSGLPSPADLGIELTEDEGNQFYDAVSGCMDFRELFFGSLAATDPAVDTCLREKISDEQLKDLVVAMFIQPIDAEPPDSSAVEAAISECQGLAPSAPG